MRQRTSCVRRPTASGSHFMDQYQSPTAPTEQSRQSKSSRFQMFLSSPLWRLRPPPQALAPRALGIRCLVEASLQSLKPIFAVFLRSRGHMHRHKFRCRVPSFRWFDASSIFNKKHASTHQSSSRHVALHNKKTCKHTSSIGGSRCFFCRTTMPLYRRDASGHEQRLLFKAVQCDGTYEATNKTR